MSPIFAAHAPKRDELAPIAQRVLDLRYHSQAPLGAVTWGFKVIRDLNVSPGGR